MVEHKAEVVISGVGGLYPEANNFEELKNLLFSKTNGVTMDSRRWDQNWQGIRSGTGKIKNVDNFDTLFFKTNPKQAVAMDIITKLILERSIEAIIDAGLSPTDLIGMNTGVFTCSTISETEMLFFNNAKGSEFALVGQSRTMQANRLSYILNLTGPSFNMDGGWICSSEALKKAKTMIENGFITSALVGVTNLCLRPELQYQFQGLNRLNQGVHTKPFSVNADGYNRSEACIVLLLQKASEAKRSYGSLLSVSTVNFGDNHEHITEHNEIHLKSLLVDSYKNVNIDPDSVEYVEAHGSGIENEDSIELNVMEEVFCAGQRKTPLKIGSVKSNVGHCEVSGLFMSIVKAIIALDSGYIPPNINYTPNEKLAAIRNRKIEVVTKKTPLVSDIVGISSFGFSNAFSHVILKRNNKIKYPLADTGNGDFMPRLILASGRNEENARGAINMIMKHGNDAEFLALTYEVFTKNISSHFHRSYSIFPSLDDTRIHDVRNVSLKKRPVWFIFSGMGSQWNGMGTYLMKLPIFAEAINKCDSVLKPRGVDIKYILTSNDPKLFDNILYSFVGIIAVQIGLVNILKALDIVPDGMIGHSLGENGCAYADGCFTVEETILSAYARGRASLETKLIPGMMAAIGLGYHQIKDRLPQDIDVACHNSASSCTISGPVDTINEFVSQLKSEGVFAKSVNVNGIAYHSRYIQSAGPTLLKHLKEAIKEPKLRSPKWISTSLPDSEWDSDLAKYSSAEYHTNNLLNSVLFEDALKHIPSDAITIEIAPHGLLQAIIKRALPDTVCNISLTKKVFGESVQFFLNAVGKMYLYGLNPKVQEIYPKVTFPVSRETPSMSILPIWDHNQQWSQRDLLNNMMNSKSAENFSTLVVTNEIHLIEYQIHGHYIIPPSFMLFDVWKLFVEINDKTIHSDQVQFQNLWFKKNVVIPSNCNSCEKYMTIQPASGVFEYNIDNEVVFSGKISFLDKNNFDTKSIQPITPDKISDTYEGYVLNDEIYSVLSNNGYCLGDNYKNIIKYNISEKYIKGYVKWINDWVYFIDGLLKFSLLEDLETQKLNAPISIREIKINPSEFQKIQEKDVYVSYNKAINEINCNGIKISDVKNMPLLLPEKKSTVVKIEEKTFVQLNHSICQNIDEFISDSMGIILETEKFNLETASKKLIVCTPYHYDDSIFKACTKSLKQILDSQLSVDTLTLTWDNIKNTTEYDESGRFITVTNDNFISDTIKVLASKKCSYVIVYSDQKLQDLKNWKIIMQQRLNDISYLAIIKKDTVFDENNVFVKQNYDNYDLSIWRTLEKCKLPTGMIYIVLKSEPLEGVNNYVKNMLLKYKSQRLRFLFILDSNAPDFNSNKSFYKNQLVKGLMINIYKNGEWGFYKRNSVQVLNEKMNLIENLIVKNITINSENLHSLQFLGLNYKDLVVENSTENEFGPLDYSCFAKNDKLFMGIASFEQTSSKIKYDSVLSWPVPSTWSPEDATTVPLTYAIAYYVFYVLCSLRKDNSILITSGLHPIGQAAIAISLDKKCDTYAVVESSQDVKLLSNIFPELPRSRILVNTNNKFDIRVMLMTKSKGVNIVLNFLSGEAFQAALRTIAYYGKFFHFSKSDMKIHSNIGTQVFLRSTSFTAIGSSMLLNESDQNKRIVHLAVMDALNKGVIKPFSRFDLTTSLRSRNIFDTMRTASTLTMPQKVVLSVSDELRNFKPLDYSICNKYQCDPDQVNVIVGNCNKLDWLDVAEWLVERGARNIVIVIKRCLMSSVISRRFDRLLSINLSIQVEPDMHLMTKEESLNWLNRLTLFRVLGSLFIINQLNCKKVDNLRYAFQNNKNKSKMTSFVCISSNGEIVCADLKSVGLRAINISWDETSPVPINVSRIMFSLDTIFQNSNTKNSSSYIWSEEDYNKSEWSQKMKEVIANYFPNTIDDMHDLNELIKKNAGFVEVSTRSPRFSQLKSVTPVFVIPGFRPKLFEPFYKQFCYPVFEARFSEHIQSIDELSNILVKEMKNISKNDSVSLIGESWGGVVALKIAQILEAQGTLVTVSLLNGDPKSVIDWAKCFLSKDYFSNTLSNMHNYHSDEFSKCAVKTDEDDLRKVKLSIYKKASKENTRKSLNWILSILRTLLETKPWPNKLYTKVLIFKYGKTAEPHKINDLMDYCTNMPNVHIVPGTDYKQMMADKVIIKDLMNTVVYPCATGIEISLGDKYKNFYFYNEKRMRLF